MAIYVCSDIHGQYGLFLRALEQVGFSDADQMYILGDVIDRGPDSIPLLQDVMNKKNVTLILGNHEFMMSQYLSRNRDGDPWMHPANAGRKTLTAYSLLPDEERREIRDFLSDLYLQIEVEAGSRAYLLSHSYFAYGSTKKWLNVCNEDVYRAVWESPWRSYRILLSFYDDGMEHIVGHKPVQTIDGEYWPGDTMPEMPRYLHDPVHHITDIDLGCAFIPFLHNESIPESYRERYSSACLCVLDLEKHAAGDPDAAVYVMPDAVQR